MDMVGGEEGEGEVNGDSNMEVYTLSCVKLIARRDKKAFLSNQ